MVPDSLTLNNCALQRLHHPVLAGAGITASLLPLHSLHPVLSGNKWLKLQGWLLLYQAGRYRGILSRAGPWSNYLHALAYACHALAIPCQVAVPQVNTPSATITDALAWGVRVLPVARQQWVQEDYWLQMAEQLGYLYIPMGADGAPGTLGVSQFFNQLTLAAETELWCALGTGTTVLGIAQSQVGHLPITAFVPGFGSREQQRLAAFLVSQAPQASIKLRADDLGRFGAIMPPLIEAMNTWWQLTGIPLDVVYTGRMVRWFLHLASQAQLNPRVHYLLVHTGGLQGNRSMVEKGLAYTGYP